MKTPGIADQIPVTRKTHNALHCIEIEDVRGQHHIGRIRAVTHCMCFGMARDRRAAQALEDADLDFMRMQRMQPVEATTEAGEVFTRQARNQVDMDQRRRFLAQPAQIGFGRGIVLPPRDARLHGLVPGLDADLEMQRSLRETQDRLLQFFRQVVGYQFEMDEQIITQALKEKLEYRQAGGHLQVEGAVDKTEMPGAAVVQTLEFAEKTFHLEGPCGLVQRGQAEFAFERAAARSFDINETARDVFIRVFTVGQRDVGERRLLAGMDFLRRCLAGKNVGAKLRKSHVAPAGDNVIGQRADALLLRFVADLGAADDDDDVRGHTFEDRHHARGFLDIPDIDAETDQPRRIRQQAFGDVRRAVAEHEFADAGFLAQGAHVGAQTAQAQRRMYIPGVDGGESDAGHDLIIASGVTGPGRF